MRAVIIRTLIAGERLAPRFCDLAYFPAFDSLFLTLLSGALHPDQFSEFDQTPKITMGKKRVLISYGVDVDAVAGWLGSYGGEDSPNDISRGPISPRGEAPR